MARISDIRSIAIDVNAEMNRQDFDANAEHDPKLDDRQTPWHYKMARIDSALAEARLTLAATPANAYPGGLLRADLVELAAVALLCAQSLAGVSVPDPAHAGERYGGTGAARKDHSPHDKQDNDNHYPTGY